MNTGLRDQELCSLQWNWEQRVPELDTSEIKRSVFVLPATSVKNRQARVVILNDVAQSVLKEVRGEHPVHVFTWENRKGQRHRVGHFRNTGWLQARRRAAARYTLELGKEAPAGFNNVRVHDLRHTFGRRLRAAGVSFEEPPGSLGPQLYTGDDGLQCGRTAELTQRGQPPEEVPQKSRNDGFAADGMRFSAPKSLI